jgi:hypothetical protein
MICNIFKTAGNTNYTGGDFGLMAMYTYDVSTLVLT